MIFLRINLPDFVQVYRYDSSQEGSDGMIFTRPGKCRYDIPSYTVPLRALMVHRASSKGTKYHIAFVVWQTIKYSDLTEVKAIAEGGFGVVYRAEHPRWETVAYKELKTSVIPDGSTYVHIQS